jgi:hypothetical protein
MLDQGSSRTAHKALLENRLARLRERMSELRADPRRAPALRAAEIEAKHITREIAAIRD